MGSAFELMALSCFGTPSPSSGLRAGVVHDDDDAVVVEDDEARERPARERPARPLSASLAALKSRRASARKRAPPPRPATAVISHAAPPAAETRPSTAPVTPAVPSPASPKSARRRVGGGRASTRPAAPLRKGTGVGGGVQGTSSSVASSTVLQSATRSKENETPVLTQVHHPDRKVGRFELLQWLNATLQTDYAHVNECADGVAYCQLLDSVVPGRVPLQKLDFGSRTKDDNVRNLRVFAAALKRLGVEREVDVEAVARAKFQENNELLRWCFAFVQKNYPLAPRNYNALARRLDAQERQARKARNGRPSLGASTQAEAAIRGVAGGPRASQQARAGSSNLYPNDVSSLLGGQAEGAGWDYGVEYGTSPSYSGGGAAARTPQGPPRQMSPVKPSLLRGFDYDDGLPSDLAADMDDDSPLFKSPPRSAARPSAPPVPSPSAGGSDPHSQHRAELESLIRYLEQELQGRLKETLGAQREVRLLQWDRDFYADKIARVESVCAQHPDSAVAADAVRVARAPLAEYAGGGGGRTARQ